VRRLITVTVLALTLGAGCGRGDEPATPAADSTPALDVTADQIEAALISGTDLGAGKWSKENDPVPSTVQVGGKVGPANVKGAEEEAIAAFRKEGGSAYVTTSIYLVDSPEVAQAVMVAHHQAESEQTWTQERKDGGGAGFKRAGPVKGLPALGDETYSARLGVTVRDADGSETERKIHYIVFRTNRLLTFVITQDTDSVPIARRQEAKVARLTT
jgi:hypothetical protein